MLAGCQMPTQPLHHSPPQQDEGEGNEMEKFMGQDKGREISHQFPSLAKQTRLGEK